MSINRYLTQPITPSASASLLAAQEPTTSQRLESQKGFNQYLLGTTKASAIHTSTTGNLVKDTEGRDGWVYTNPVLGNALNVLIFDGTHENLQYGDIQSLFLECSCDKINSSKSVPQVVIYTKPQGAGDLDPTYHATITLKYNDAGKYRLGNGEEVNFCYKTSPVQYGFDLSSRLILFETISTNNDPAFSEEIAFIRIQTDTTCPANECDVRIISAGFQAQGRGSDFPKDTSRRVKFLGTDVQKVDIDMLAEDIATKTNQETIINATIRDINNTDSIGDGSSNATAVALGYDRTNGKGRSLLVGADGGLVIKAMGSEDATITGDQHQIHVDGSGNVQTNVVNTVNINAANSINSGVTNDPVNSVACGMRGRTTITDASTETFCLVDTDGHLQCDIQSGTITASVSDVVIKGNDGNDGAGTDRVIKTDGNGAVIVDPSVGSIITADGTTQLQSVMVNGNYSGNLRTIKVGDGGAVNTEIDHSWDNTNQIFNTEAIADGDSAESSTFDLGQGVSHEIGKVEFFLDNSAGVSISVDGLASYDGTNFFDAGNLFSINSSGTAIFFSQDDVGIGQGHRYMRLKVTNNDGGGTSTNISCQVGFYN